MQVALSLERLGFAAPRSDRAPGLVAVRAASSGDRPDEGGVLRDVAATFGEAVQYVYFRRFDEGRASQPLALVVDNATGTLGTADLARVHRLAWLTGIAPLLYVGWPTRVDVLSCARGADFLVDGQERYAPAKQIEIAGAIAAELERFSAQRLADGSLWEDPLNANLAAHKESAQAALIDAIVKIDRELEGDSNPQLRRMVLSTVLIKYLDDRRVFPNAWFARFSPGASSFFDVLAAGNPNAIDDLFEQLGKRFNGDVFAGAMKRISSKQLRKLADLVEARSEGAQRVLWARYSFEHLPVEVISNIYQRFVRGPTAVYTPPFLASFLLDRVMPYDAIQGTERVLDPACGSGVFLVGAFKRLVNAWRAKNDWARPDVNTLKQMLRTSIFGSEIDPFAVELTAFSLCLALCDALRPDVIWKQLKFDKLCGENLTARDFFETPPSGHFDLVVGNPPFESKLSAAAIRHDRNAENTRPKLPDKQIAHLFLERAIDLLGDRGRICLLQPAGLLYNRNLGQFRAHLFGRCRVDEVLDFVSIRGLYDGADTKTIAIVASAGTPRTDDTIAHVTLRRSMSAKQRIALETDHYDRHSVRYAQVDSLVWRANLLGGGRLPQLAQRFAVLPTLADFLEARKDWIFSEGFKVGNGVVPAPELSALRLLTGRAMTGDGIDESKIVETVSVPGFERPRDLRLYRPPVIVIHEHEDLAMAFVGRHAFGFDATMAGIKAPERDRAELRAVFDRLVARRRQYRFLCALLGTTALNRKATAIGKSDIDALPYPENEDQMDLAFWETVLQDDVLDGMLEYVRIGQESRIAREPASDEAVLAYAETFRRMLGSVYSNLQIASPVRAGNVVCQPFHFGTKPDPAAVDVMNAVRLHDVMFADNGGPLRTVRVLRYYAENMMIVAKPNRLRYWIRSTAIRDADETMMDLYRDGY
jgi:hypothetical protein